MGELTDGQKLLTAFQSSVHDRERRHHGTLGAKMQATKDKLLQGVAISHTASSGDHLSLLGKPEPQVHSLLPDVTEKQASTVGIQSMLASKASSHDATWQQYLAANEGIRQHNHQAAAAVAAGLLGIQANIERELLVLSDDKIMMLDKHQLHQVWETVVDHCSSTASWISGLAADLQAAELDKQLSLQTTLQTMVSDMCRIAHLDDAQVQRLVEQEVLALNMGLLDNRQATAEMLQQLHTHQLNQEQLYHQRWEAAAAEWRTRRSRHAVQQFTHRLKAELSEPAARLEMYKHISMCQEEAHTQLVQQCRQAGQLVPPHLTPTAVARWVMEADQWGGQWQHQVLAHLQKLRKHEGQIEQQIEDWLQDLRDEVTSYEGFTAEVEQLLQQDAHPVLSGRREAAAQLLQQTECFLERQAAEWQLAVQVLGSWLRSLVSLFSNHKASVKRAETGIKAILKEARQEFEQADADREDTLDAAIVSVIQGSSEGVLDVRASAAVCILSAIEAGYRAYAAGSVQKVREYPVVIRRELDLYTQCLCGLLHVHPQAQPQIGCAQQPVVCVTHSGSAAPQQQQQQRQQLDVLQDGRYTCVDDLWTALYASTEKPWMEHLHTACLTSPLDNVGLTDAESGGAECSAAGDSAATCGIKAKATAVGGGRLSAKQQAEAVTAVAAATAAAAATVAEAATAHALAVAAASASPQALPVALNGSVLCLQLAVPDAVVQTSLLQLQVSLLEEMESYSSRVQGGAEAWAASVEEMLTEELDSRLRAHRPRAGRIEEEVRAVRSMELLAQRRHVEDHMCSQSRAVKQQQAMFCEDVMQLRSSAEAWVSNVAGYDRLLANALSSKGLDICWREAQAYKAHKDKQLLKRIIEIGQKVVSSCNTLVEVNRRFQAEQLKLFEEGGKYAMENVGTYKAGITAMDLHIAQQRQQQQQSLTALQQELSSALSSTLATVEQSLPSYKQDMALLELINKHIEGAKKKALLELSKNSQDCEAIGITLIKLQDALNRVAERQSLPYYSRVACMAANSEGDLVFLQESHQLLELVNQLRQQLLKLCQVLELLHSPGLVNFVINIRLPSKLQPVLPPGVATTTTTGVSNNTAAIAPPVDTAGGTKSAPCRPGTGQKKGRPDSTGQPSPPGRQNPSSITGAAAAPATLEGAAYPLEAPAVSLAKDISAVIHAAQQEVEVAARAYYTSKDASRPIRYPDKIAPGLTSVYSGLRGLQQMLQQHVDTAARNLRMQVVQTQRLLERVPDAVLFLMAGHLLLCAQQQCSRLLREFRGKQQVLEQQLELNKRHLQPGMLHPNRRSELESLRACEASRQTAAAELTATCASQCLGLIASQAEQITTAVNEVCMLLLFVFDGMVMSADLVPGPGTAADAMTGLQHRTMMELQRLALAQQEAEPAGPAAAPPPATALCVDNSGVAGTKPTGKAAGCDAIGISGDLGASAARPFPYMHWRLSAGSFSLSSLGWLLADQQVVMMTSPQSVNLPPAIGEPVATPAAGTLAPPQNLAAIAAPFAAAAAPGGHHQQKEPPSHPDGASVTGYDTPCQRTVIRAQQVCLHRAKSVFTAVVAGLKQQLHQWTRQEQLWQLAWAQMIENLDTV